MTHTTAPDTIIHLHADGISLVLDVTGGDLPGVVYWGPDLGRLDRRDGEALIAAATVVATHETPPGRPRLSILPAHWTGWVGRPGLRGSRRGRDWSPRLRVDDVTVDGHPAGAFAEAGAARVDVRATDEHAGLAVDLAVELGAGGVLRAQATVTNDGVDGYQLDDLVLALPVPESAREVLDFGGRWGKERSPQRHRLGTGAHVREGRRGRTGADAATVLHLGEHGFGFARGRVWAVHVGWSGNHTHYAERIDTGEQVIGGGELLLPGEVVLDHGARYESPWVYGVFGVGLDDVARRFHTYLRARKRHVGTARPVTFNAWEAVYFDQDPARLIALAERAAAIGIERFVVDDGWFGGRRHDRAGLGDWVVSPDVWPDGLHPLVNRVRELGMQFGLWFEPEMINVDSDAARAHPEWILQTGGRLPIERRHQQVIDLANPDCYAHVRDQLAAVIDEYELDYIKWDHNRDLVDAGHTADGRPAGHDQTLAFYRLVDELRATRPGLEIESCSSGGARVDLGVLARTDRVWASDVSDPLDRQQINGWTAQLVAPELIGSHVASRHSHTTTRTHDLSFRAATALFGHFGVEWDLATADPDEVAELERWIALHKELRSMLFTGDVVRADLADDAIHAFGVLSPDRRHALIEVAALARPDVASIGRVPVPGLEPAQRYRVRPVSLGLRDAVAAAPAWFGDDDGTGEYSGTIVTGRLLETGLRMPEIRPEHAMLVRIDAV